MLPLFNVSRASPTRWHTGFQSCTCPLCCPNDDPAWNFSADASFIITVRGSDAFIRAFGTVEVNKTTTLAVSTRTDREDRSDDRPSIATPSVVDARSPSARSARRMARHTLTTAVQIAIQAAEAQAAAVAPASPAPYDPETR